MLKEGDDCPDSTLAVKGLTNAPQYFIGDQPKFTMVVTNIGLVACKRDVGAAVLAAYVYSLDNKRLWSNLDCAPSNENLVKTFTPGEQVTTAVTWTGMGSAPHCPLPRPAIGAGTYNLVVQLGNLRSYPVPFVMNQPPAPPGPVGAPGAPAAVPPARGAPGPSPRGLAGSSYCALPGLMFGDGRLGQLRQPFSHMAGPHRADALHRLQVVSAGRQQALQRAERADQ